MVSCAIVSVVGLSKKYGKGDLKIPNNKFIAIAPRYNPTHPFVVNIVLNFFCIILKEPP